MTDELSQAFAGLLDEVRAVEQRLLGADPPLDEADVGNVNKISQYLGVAKSTTELVTNDDGYVVL